MDFSKDQLPQIYELLEKYQKDKNVIIFKSRKEADDYLEVLLKQQWDIEPDVKEQKEKGKLVAIMRIIYNSQYRKKADSMIWLIQAAGGKIRLKID